MTHSLVLRFAQARKLCLACYFSLQLLYFCKTVLWPMGGRDPNVTMWLIHALPLLPFLPGMLKGNYRAYTWLAFVILLYFMQTVIALFSPQASVYHWIALVLIVALFASATLFIRWQGQYFQQIRSTTEGEP